VFLTLSSYSVRIIVHRVIVYAETALREVDYRLEYVHIKGINSHTIS